MKIIQEYNRSELIKQQLSKLSSNQIGVEIGTFKGDFSKEILENTSLKLYMVDVWRPLGDEYEDASNHTLHQTAYADTMDNIKGYEDRAVMIRSNSKQAVELFNDESLDFVFIDANHAYDFVKEDIKLWYPKVKKGGIFAGHDYMDLDWYRDSHFLPNGKDKHIYTNTFDGRLLYNGVFGVNPAVAEFCKEMNYDFNVTKEWFGTWWLIK